MSLFGEWVMVQLDPDGTVYHGGPRENVEERRIPTQAWMVLVDTPKLIVRQERHGYVQVYIHKDLVR